MPVEAWIALAAIVLTIVGASWRLSWQMSKSLTMFTTIGTQQAVEINRMNVAIEKIEIAVASIAVDRERATSLERRVAKLEIWYDELRRGVGKIE